MGPEAEEAEEMDGSDGAKMGAFPKFPNGTGQGRTTRAWGNSGVLYMQAAELAAITTITIEIMRGTA